MSDVDGGRLGRASARRNPRGSLLSFCLCVSVVLTSLSFVPPVRAQRGDSYDRVISQAVSEYSAGHWEEAYLLFRKAHDLNPSARTWRGLGLTAFELRRYVEAAGQLESALIDPRRPLTSTQRDEVTQLLERCRDYISVYRIKVNPATAEVLVDGKAQSLRDGKLSLDPGAHTVVVRATGYEERRQELRSDAGARDELSIELQSQGSVRALPNESAPVVSSRDLEQSVVLPAPMAIPKASSTRAGARLWTWVAAGGAAALASVTIGLRVGVRRQARNIESCSEVQPSQCSDFSGRGKALQRATYALGATTVIAAAAAVTLYFVEPRHRQSTDLALSVAPGELLLSGSF
jgi:hypothetical protein